MVSRKKGTLFITHCNCYYLFVLFLKMCYVVCYIFGYIVNTLKFKNKKMQQNQIFTLFVLVPRRGNPLIFQDKSMIICLYQTN